ncbi:MAG: hypothetical protein JSW51_02065 [Gemmatimonadota bacterium]|nr:MAG: hypothetical protein JSW51_02065 [Gemmatimonadota bacterium]
MRRLLAIALASGLIGLLPNPRPADAQQEEDGKLKKCLQEAVKECDEDFKPEDHKMVAIRGWCYMIRGAICYVH